MIYKIDGKSYSISFDKDSNGYFIDIIDFTESIDYGWFGISKGGMIDFCPSYKIRPPENVRKFCQKLWNMKSLA